MSESDSDPNSSDNGEISTADQVDALAELRHLLFSQEQQRLGALQERLDNPQVRTEDVSEIIPEAIRQSIAHSDKLALALAPTIEDALQVSIKRNPKGLVDVISPLMGPAIRRSIFQTISGMVESFNKALEHGLSPKSFKWRLEAYRTGKPFAEVVLIHTLVYRVEQVFLIHRETGLLLQHVTAAMVEAMDADMVSGMLTAIRDFVHDSFGGGEGDELQTMQVGERTVWVEPGPGAVLAAVVRGTPPRDLHAVFQNSMEQIHLEQQADLDAFEGDATPFEAAHFHLENCLKTHYKSTDEEPEQQPQPGSKPLVPWIAGGLAALVLGVWIGLGIFEDMRWSEYLLVLAAQPGIVVVDAGKRAGQYYVAGLRDPLASDPAALLAATGFAVEAVVYDWEPYQSFAPSFAAIRARQVLDPPEGVRLMVGGDTLYAVGAAPHQWILDAHRLVRSLPGIAVLDAGQLQDLDRSLLDQLRRDIEQRSLFFAKDDSGLRGMEHSIYELAAQIRRLTELSRKLDLELRIQIITYAKTSDAEAEDTLLGWQRAWRVADALTLQGVSAAILKADNAKAETPDGLAGPWNRKVFFNVVINPTIQQGSLR